MQTELTAIEFGRQSRPDGFQFHSCGAFYFDGPGGASVSLQFQLQPSTEPDSYVGIQAFRADNKAGAIAWLIERGVNSEVAEIVTAHAFDHQSHAEYFAIDGLYRLQKYGYGIGYGTR